MPLVWFLLAMGMIMTGMGIIGIRIGAVGGIRLITMGLITGLTSIGRLIDIIRIIRHIPIMEGVITIPLDIPIGPIGPGMMEEGVMYIGGTVETVFKALLVGSEMLKKGC